jgi:hypothetical protein
MGSLEFRWFEAGPMKCYCIIVNCIIGNDDWKGTLPGKTEGTKGS